MVVANAANAQVVSDALAERLARVARGARRPVAGDRPRRRPGPALRRRPRPADRRRPRRAALLRDRRGHRSPGIPALVARTGYTGEDGFEVFVETRRTARAVGRAARRGRARRRRCRSGWARATRCASRPACRCTATSSTASTNPFDAGLGRVVKLDKAGDFVGRAALERVAADGPAKRARRARSIEGRGIARHGYPVHVGERRTGVVTSGTQSPTLGVPIAMAYVAPGDAEPGTMVDVEIRDARVPRAGRAAARSIGGAADVSADRSRPALHPRPRVGPGRRRRGDRRDHRLRRGPARRHRLRRAAGRRPRRSRQLAGVRRRRVGQGRQRPVRAGRGRGRRHQRRAGRRARSSSTATRTARAG